MQLGVSPDWGDKLRTQIELDVNVSEGTKIIFCSLMVILSCGCFQYPCCLIGQGSHLTSPAIGLICQNNKV